VLRDRLSFANSEPVIDPAETAAASISALLEQRGAKRSELVLRRTPFAEWALLVPEPRGPLSFDRFPFQKALYSEEVTSAREVVVMKAAQCGLSAWAIRLALFSADVLGRTALYTFPTEKELQRFSSRRLRSAIRGSEHLMSRMPAAAIDSVFQKQVGPGWVELRGTNRPVDYLDADIAIFDEYSASSAENIATAERRVSGPDSAGQLRRLGVPSYPGTGISAAYEESDARVWNAKCEACGHWNPLRGLVSFEQNVDLERGELVCANCGRGLDVRAGEWVATYPDRDVIGFAVPKLVIPGVKLGPIIKASRSTKPYERAAFLCRDLGEPFAADEQRLTLEQVMACVDHNLRPQLAAQTFNPVVMGIDVAGTRPLNLTIEEMLSSDGGRKLWIGEVEDEAGRSAFDQIAQLIRDFKVCAVCIDGQPESMFSRALAEAFPQQVYRVSFAMPAGGRRDPPIAVADDEKRYISAWRTVILDQVVNRFRRRQVVLPDPLPEGYSKQLGNAVRVVEVRGGWRHVAVYQKLGADDYLMAEAYALLARELVKRASWREARALHAGPDFDPMLGTGDDYIDLTSPVVDDRDVWSYLG
jgi:hypothetical protein